MYVWKIYLSIDNVEAELTRYAHIHGIYFVHSLHQMVIRKPYYIINAIPVNFQPSLLLKYKKISESVTELTGKFGFPKIFYILYYTIFFLSFMLFYLISKNKHLLLEYSVLFVLVSVFLLYILRTLLLIAFRKVCCDAKRFVDDFAYCYREY